MQRLGEESSERSNKQTKRKGRRNMLPAFIQRVDKTVSYLITGSACLLSVEDTLSVFFSLLSALLAPAEEGLRE